MFSFLNDLQKNNHKQWMDENRKRYHTIRNEFIYWLDGLNQELLDRDEHYFDTPGKKGINRINNNLLYHPNKPVYKNHFGAALDKAPKTADYYIEVGLSGCFLAGGFWRPAKDVLTKLRDAIDYNGEVLEAIINKPSFKEVFGELYKDEKLSRPPKGFDKDHPHIELIKNKSFAVLHRLNEGEVFADNFREKVFAVYDEMLPFRRYLNEAAQFDA